MFKISSVILIVFTISVLEHKSVWAMSFWDMFRLGDRCPQYSAQPDLNVNNVYIQIKKSFYRLYSSLFISLICFYCNKKSWKVFGTIWQITIQLLSMDLIVPKTI